MIFPVATCALLCSLVGHVTSGKIRADSTGVELADYRFGLGQPYVKIYERDNYRGKVYFQMLSKNCKNLADAYQNWASSIDVQKRCITLCDQLNCEGHCERIHGDPNNPNNKGSSRLSDYGLNDKVKSIKFCYSAM